MSNTDGWIISDDCSHRPSSAPLILGWEKSELREGKLCEGRQAATGDLRLNQSSPHTWRAAGFSCYDLACISLMNGDGEQWTVTLDCKEEIDDTKQIFNLYFLSA